MKGPVRGGPPHLARASRWLERLERPAGGDRALFEHTYGGADIIPERLNLIRRTLAGFIARFGDAPVRVVRCPGRINLRGMHVDTHGGWLNLITHEREVVVVSSAVDDDAVRVSNLDRAYAEVSFRMRPYLSSSQFSGPWFEFISSDDIRSERDSTPGDWGHYVRGSVLSAIHRCNAVAPNGINAIVGSDLPKGASLSSSAALCLSLIVSVTARHDKILPPTDLIDAVQDAEWFTGARTGKSDPGAMALCGAGEVVCVAFRPDDSRPNLRGRRIFPDNLRILVINSFTTRNLSGAAQVRYSQNRFAYSMALGRLRSELIASGAPHADVDTLASLSDFAQERVERLLGGKSIYDFLSRIPHQTTLDEMEKWAGRDRVLERYARYFGQAPEELRPHLFPLRGPLIYALAESARAARFFDALAQEDAALAGRLMTIGHHGDRVSTDPHHGTSDAELSAYAVRRAALWEIPGDFGAGSAPLNALVDAAIDAGALGASLTGAGMAGSVIALCETDRADEIAEHLKHFLASERYASLSGGASTDEDVSVLVNRAPSGASEIVLDEL